MPHITPEHIAKYQEIYLRIYGKSLDYDTAYTQVSSLVGYLYTIYLCIKKNAPTLSVDNPPQQ